MKKLSKAERVMLEVSDKDNYNTCRCPEHGIYQNRKDQPEEKQVCLYCKKKNPILSQEVIKKLIEK
jgi:uncharacterized cupin superfamily protein